MTTTEMAKEIIKDNKFLTHIAAPRPKNHKKQIKFNYFRTIFDA